MEEGYDGLLRDKTRPSRIPRLASNITERVVTQPTSTRRCASGSFGILAGPSTSPQTDNGCPSPLAHFAQLSALLRIVRLSSEPRRI